MKNQQVELDEKTLTSVLDEHVTELKEIKDFMKQQGQQLDQKNRLITDKQNENAKLIADFEQKYKNIQVIAPKADTAPVLIMLADGLVTIKEVVTRQINALLDKKNILVLPEDGGKRFSKVLSKRFAIMAAIILISSFIGLLGLRYWYLNSQNNNFHKIWYWTYIHKDSISRQRMNDELDSFKLPGVNRERSDSINAYEKQQKKEMRIRELQREADSLKTTN
jgi:hypothetical protein